MVHPLEVRTVRQHLAARGVTLTTLHNGTFEVSDGRTRAVAATVTGAHIAGLNMTQTRQQARLKAFMANQTQAIAKGARH